MSQTPSVGTAAVTAFAAPSRMPFTIWVFVRLLVPTGPILIQYLLFGLGLYKPPFPQPTYMVLLFSLALVTLTEYQGLASAIYGSVIPAVGASVLYTAYIMKIDFPDQHQQTLLVGFYFWLFLLMINVIRVCFDIAKRFLGGSKP